MLSVLVVVTIHDAGVKEQVVVVSTANWYVNAVELEMVQDCAVNIPLDIDYKIFGLVMLQEEARVYTQNCQKPHPIPLNKE